MDTLLTNPIADLQALVEHEIEQAYKRGYADALGRRAFDEPAFGGGIGPASLSAVVDAAVSVTQPAFLPGRARVDVGGVTFTRADHETRPYFPQAMRLEANRALSDDDQVTLHHLVAYTYAATLRSTGIGRPERDSTHSFVVTAETVYSHRTDPMGALAQFEVDLDTYLLGGTPVRKTDRAGAKTAGTRAVDGLNDPSLRVAVYYDSVTSGAVA